MSSGKLIVLPVVLLVLLAWAHPATSEEKASKSKAQKDLRRIQEELKKVRKKEGEAKRQERSVLSDLERMDQSLAKKRAEVRRLEARLAEVAREIDDTGREMDDYADKAKRKESDLRERLRAMYKTQRAGGPWMILASGDYGLLLRRYKYLSVMSQRDKRMMEGYESDVAELSRYKDKLGRQRESYDRVKKARDAEARGVLAEEGQKKTLLASIRQQKGLYESMARELEESGRQMRELLKRLEAEKKTIPKPSLPEGAPLSAGLDWPVSGKVTGFFGKQKHPEYNTYIFKNGIEISAPMGTEVKAVEGAVVAFANWFKGLGLVAILRHGADFYSVYAHLSELRVKTGDKVARGQVIATLGDTGAPSGPSLYFEVRKGSEPQDPMRWLKKR